MQTLVIFAIIGWVFSALSKAAKQKQEAEKKKARAARPAPEAPAPAPAAPMLRTETYRPLTTTLHEGDSLYGTLAHAPADHPEGEPLHEGESAYDIAPALVQAYAGQEAARAVEIPGLHLRLDGGALVQGVIFSEILTRKTPRRAAQ
ncbi:MAG: hypothetical protein LBN04_04790 [Oscillospiraceae bacterium]|jgi:hypothetical protein|nr:hypothetical protein [Oscillospiraceae bacterium]